MNDKTLLPCPFCGGAVEDAFENLWDNEEGEIEKCWTVLHSCPVLKTNVWAHADSKAEAIAAWNTRAPTALQARVDVLEADNARLVKANGLRMDELHKEREEAKLWFERAQEWKAHNEALEAALLAVVDATRAYLPPDGISEQECLNRILRATDNPTINPIIAALESKP